MKEQIYFCMDIAEYMMFGAMLSWFLKDMPAARFWRDRKILSVLMCLQYAAVRMAFSYSSLLKRFLYGDEMFIVNSRQSIVPVLAGMTVTLLAGFLFYARNRMRLLSLVTAFYALYELIRFALYPLAVKSITQVTGYYNRLFWEEEAIGAERYMQLVERAEIIWNLSVFLMVFFALFFCIRKYRQYFGAGNLHKVYGEALLFVPALLGFVFTVMLRSILFYYDKEVYSLIEHYVELNLMIPILSVLCVASILLSVKMLGEMEMEHEKRREAELYQSRAAELEAHVRDMESVNIQIRGMKHDMKHYIADVNALLAQAFSGDAAAEEEARRYVASMQTSLENLDLKYQTKNPVTDVILGRYFRLAAQRKIEFFTDFIYPYHLGIDVFDISVILNNGLDNAFEACETEEGRPYVSLSVKQKGNMFLLTIENAFSGTLTFNDGFPVSQKQGLGHGLGLKNIRGCAEKYFGKVKACQKGNSFCLTVMLQGRPDLMTENR